MAISVALY